MTRKKKEENNKKFAFSFTSDDPFILYNLSNWLHASKLQHSTTPASVRARVHRKGEHCQIYFKSDLTSAFLR
jgi:hypothetical protein